MRRTVMILTVVLAALVGWTLALPPVQAAFTDSTTNGMNTFQAAATFPGQGVSGRIVDAEEPTYGIAGATVTLTPTAGGAAVSTTSDEAGNYSFADVLTGSYDVSVSREGWDPGSTGIVVTGNVTDVDVTLAPQFFTVQGRLINPDGSGVNPNNEVLFTSLVTGEQVTSGPTNTPTGKQNRGCFEVPDPLRGGEWTAHEVGGVALLPGSIEITKDRLRADLDCFADAMDNGLILTRQ